MALVTQAEFAGLHDVSRKTVTTWKQAGYLVFSGSKVDVEKSDRRLGERRLGRFAAVTPPVTQAADPLPPPRGGVFDDDDEVMPDGAEEFERRVLAGDYPTLVQSERVKESLLALKHIIEVRQRSGSLVEIGAAEAVLFEAARAWRDSWMNWPVRVGPLIAADLGLEADKVVQVLTGHVHKHLDELGEPEADLRRK